MRINSTVYTLRSTPTLTRLFVFLCLGISTLLPAQNWDQIIKAAASDRATTDFFGYSVAISGDYAIVGAYQEDEDAAGGARFGNAGSAYIFKRTGTTWAQEAKIVASDRASGDYFGYSVAISGDYAIVGAYAEDENAAGGATMSRAGSAYIFKRTGTTWAQESKIVASDRAIDDYLGYSVAIDGDYAIVGAYNEDENAAGGATLENPGSAYIFKRTGTTWAQESKIVASDRAISDFFGLSVAISGDYAIVGAFNEDEDAAGGATFDAAGSAYIFKRTGTTWAQESKIVASDRSAGDNFGRSVAISGDYVIVGAFADAHDATGGGAINTAGSAYIFKRTGTTWAQESKIVASDRAAGDLFGYAVAISGDYAIIGAYNEDENATGGVRLSNAGSAYTFKRTGTTWAQEAKIVASDRALGDYFGRSVAISGDYALVGADLEDEDAAGGATSADAGSAYFFNRTIPCTTPTAYTVTGTGSYCMDGTGIAVGLSNSETGVTYQLKNGAADVGSPVSGTTGSAISFGNQTTAATYTVLATRTTGGCTATMTGSAIVTMTANVTPSVVIAASPSGAITAGTSVTFTATPTNGGTAPMYEWNGDAPTTSNTYTSTTLADGDVVNCLMTPSTGICVSPAMATSNTITMTVTTVLSVELLDFKAKNTELGNVLTWTTAHEVNNKGFQVERLNSLGSWDILGFKIANHKASTYKFTDNHPFSTSYYRLRQIDNDGTETLSKVVSVFVKGSNNLKIYPNPVSDLLLVETDNKADYQILNLLGQAVLTGKTPPSGVGGLDVSALPQGTYFLKIGEEQVKFVKQ